MRSQEKFEDFQKKYPNLFREYPRSGFDARPGWTPLLHNLCAVIEDHIKQLPEELREHVQCAQVKEKFGTLRFYMTQETPYITGAIAVAELLSYETCETCGLPGKVRSGGWVLTLCDKHHKAREKKKKEDAEKWAKEHPEEDPDESDE